MTVVNQILSRLDNINKPQHKFLQVLLNLLRDKAKIACKL
jgi:hypothetical protein